MDNRQELNRHHVRENQSDVVVGQAHLHGLTDFHTQDQPGTFEAVRLGRRDSFIGREDDVRPEAEGARLAQQRRSKEAGRAGQVHEGASGDGLLQGEIQLNATKPIAQFPIKFSSIK